MSRKFTELRFEEWIEQSLLNNGYQNSFIHSNEFENKYDKNLCLIEEGLVHFIKVTQKEEYEKLYSQFDSSTDQHLLKTIDKTINQRGIIDTLRNGVDTRGCGFDLVYFKPKSSLNKDHQYLYEQNIFTVVRQLHYSNKNRNSIDIVIFLNGIPIITMELKNQLTGQNIIHSQNQYKFDRDPKEPLLKFQRCLVHFCVDNDKVSMTTQLRGDKTKFFPYNKGIINPIVEGDYKTEYLWNDILKPDSILDIIENFAFVSKESEEEWDAQKGKVVTKNFDVQIFPRYHQLDVIRKLRKEVKREGVGNNYLIQHTTGSGKSYSIGWLSHTLTSLYQNEEDTQRMFDTILVITDRKVLDKQLQNTVSKLEQTEGVVNPVDINSDQLRRYLESGKDIIITTIQKFPFVSEVISNLKGNTFGVVIDEVHSSQSGETSKHLKKSLTNQSQDSEDEEIDYEEVIRNEIASRGKQDHISFFGFTGTPKAKTLELFGRKNQQGKFEAFHYYTMKQSIAEGFTLDVLENYTTYKRYFKLKQKEDKDKSGSESKMKRALINYVDSHADTIRDKVTIILDHFVNNASKEINGRARGMVVVRSRKHCVLFHEEMVKQMRQRNLNYSCLVAYSGSIRHNGRDNTESSLNTENGLSTSIPKGLKNPKYRLLIVSSKYQTGFDEPLLQSMYIDKKLSGVQCVQTLSRLNRTTSGKTETFVLDFANETDDIVDSFKDYYTTTILSEETDPDKLYQMLYDIEQFNLYTQYQLDEFCKEFYSDSSSDEKIQPIINTVVKSFNDNLNEEQQEDFKSKIQAFIRMYLYISQISTFGEVKWEKSYVFLSFLNKKLPKRESESISISDAVDLDSLRIQMIGKSKLSLEGKDKELKGISGEGGKLGGEEEPVLLSDIIKKMNEVFGANLSEDDKRTLSVVREKVNSDKNLEKVMNGNNTKDVQYEFYESLFKDTMIDYHGDRLDFYKKVMDKKILPILVKGLFKEFTKSNSISK